MTNHHTPPGDTAGGRVSNRVDVRDVWRIMSEFCPGSVLSSAMFVDRVNQLGRAYGWSDEIMLYAVHDRLKDPARQWINAMPIFQRWTDFVEAFLADFPSETNIAELNMRMMRTRMYRNEAYADYFYRMLALGRRGGLEDAAIITYIINSIYDETTKKVLTAMQFARCADLLRTLTNLNVGERKPFVPQQSQQPSTAMPGKPQGAIQWSKPMQTTQTGIVCYRCRGDGHIARNCPKNTKSERVNKFDSGDYNDDVDEEKAAVNNIAVVKRAKELCKEIFIDGDPEMKCTALIDSGSVKSLIKKTIADNCKKTKMICREKLMGFAGGELWCIEKIKVDVKID